MKSILVKVGVPVAILMIAGVIMAGMFAARKEPEKKPIEDKAYLVDVVPVQKQDLNFMVRSQGTVTPKVQSILSAQVAGRIDEVASVFIEGGMFRKGDRLLQLEQVDFETELQLAEAELARARASLDEEIAQGRVAREEWRSVNKTAPELGLRKPQLAREQANVKAAEAQVERARRNLARATIVAPFDGMVRSRQVNVGQYVGVGAQLATLFSTEVAEVRLPLTDNDLAYLQLPQNRGATEVVLTATVAGRPVTWQAVLARDEGIIDEQNRVVYAVAEIQDPYLRDSEGHTTMLNFGRFVQAQIRGNFAEGLMVLPREVLRLDGTVLIADDSNKMRIRDVVIQRADERQVYIQSGIVEDERVIVSPVPNPYDGMSVRLLSDDGDSNKQGGNAVVAGAGGQ